MAASIGRPAVPPGSPSSLKRYCWPIFQAQQLCEAAGSLRAARKACAAAASVAGAARARKRLLRISSWYSQAALRVQVMGVSEPGAAWGREKFVGMGTGDGGPSVGRTLGGRQCRRQAPCCWCGRDDVRGLPQRWIGSGANAFRSQFNKWRTTRRASTGKSVYMPAEPVDAPSRISIAIQGMSRCQPMHCQGLH